MQVIWHLQLVSFKSLRGTPAPHHHWEGTEQSSIFLPLQHPEGERVWASGGGGVTKSGLRAEESKPRPRRPCRGLVQLQCTCPRPSTAPELV